MAFYLLYRLTFYLFAVQEFLVVVPTVVEGDADFQRTKWPNEKKISARPVYTDETCRSIARLFGSNRNCLQSLNNVVAQRTRGDRPAPPGLTEGTLTLGDCPDRRCLQNDDQITRKESVADDDVTEGASPPGDETLTSGGDDEAAGSDPPVPVSGRRMRMTRRRRRMSGGETPGAKRSLRKRGYTDPTDLCIQFHCSNRPRGTLIYLKCLRDYRCNNGRR